MTKTQTAALPTWTKTPTGYSLGLNSLANTGRTWTLTRADGSQHDLGKRARFDHAEALIAAA